MEELKKGVMIPILHKTEINALEMNIQKSKKHSTHVESRLEQVLECLVNYFLSNALDELNSSVNLKAINKKVLNMNQSPSKRTHQDYLDDTRIATTPLVIFKDSEENQNVLLSHSKFQTPGQKSFEFPSDQRHIWDKENYDPSTKQYSTDRKKKMKGLIKGNQVSGARIPLAEISKNSHQVILSFESNE